MQVFGQKQGSRQLFDVLKDMGIPSSYRPHVPVLAVAHKVYAIPPLQISEEARVGASEAPILIQFTPSPVPRTSTDKEFPLLRPKSSVVDEAMSEGREKPLGSSIHRLPGGFREHIHTSHLRDNSFFFFGF